MTAAVRIPEQRNEDDHLRVLIEVLEREGRSEREIVAALRQAKRVDSRREGRERREGRPRLPLHWLTS